MANLPTPENAAHHILAGFMTAGRREGESLRANSILGMFMDAQWRDEDRIAGLKYGVEKGWLELLDDQGSCRITREGYSEAQEDENR